MLGLKRLCTDDSAHWLFWGYAPPGGQRFLYPRSRVLVQTLKNWTLWKKHVSLKLIVLTLKTPQFLRNTLNLYVFKKEMKKVVWSIKENMMKTTTRIAMCTAPVLMMFATLSGLQAKQFKQAGQINFFLDQPSARRHTAKPKKRSSAPLDPLCKEDAKIIVKGLKNAGGWLKGKNITGYIEGSVTCDRLIKSVNICPPPVQCRATLKTKAKCSGKRLKPGQCSVAWRQGKPESAAPSRR